MKLALAIIGCELVGVVSGLALWASMDNSLRFNRYSGVSGEKRQRGNKIV